MITCILYGNLLCQECLCLFSKALQVLCILQLISKQFLSAEEHYHLLLLNTELCGQIRPQLLYIRDDAQVDLEPQLGLTAVVEQEMDHKWRRDLKRVSQKRVETGGDNRTARASQSRFELPVEQVDYYRLVTAQMVVPNKLSVFSYLIYLVLMFLQ